MEWNWRLKSNCDSSLYEWGTVLPHILQDGSKKIITSASQTLTKIKRNYFQRGTIIFRVKRFHRYLYERSAKIFIALLRSLHEYRRIPLLAASRIQTEAVNQRCSVKKVFLEISQNSQEKHLILLLLHQKNKHNVLQEKLSYQIEYVKARWSSKIE